MLSVQSLITGTSFAQTESLFVETLISVLPTQVESVYTESALSGTPPAQVESAYGEVMLATTTTPGSQIESAYIETILTIAAPTVVESSYLEVILLPRAVQRFVGWGSPI
jgi:hypothetical protein